MNEKASLLPLSSCSTLEQIQRKQAWDVSGVPKRHRDRDMTNLQNDPGGWTKTYFCLRHNLGTGMFFALIGPRGTGKTQIGCDVICEATTGQGMTALYAKAIQFFMDLKGTYRKGSEETEKSIVARYRKPDLLVLDEIASRGETDWEDRLLEHLLDERYSAKRDTILIGNFETPKAFDTNVGPSIVSRIQETGGLMVCDWKSFRSNA